ncbi:MAG: twin-arginine translocase subunit TatC [Deltaproteobacteria bacterium]|nr:MAG: twin-arginine translocase subunit TatC [Deltaproteobacteria bacterium]
MENEQKTEKINISEHLAELRTRLIKCSIAVLSGFILCYIFKEKIFYILVKPLTKALGENNTIIFTGIPEAFFTYIKTALLSGIIVVLPFIFYQFWKFIAPGLYTKEQKTIIILTFLSIIFFSAGASFGYFFVFPYGFKFLLAFANENIRALPSMKEYFTFASKLLFAFGMAFELPLLLTGLAKMGIASSSFFKKNRKYAILIFFTFAAIITPPDVVTQIMMAVPLIILYELSIIGAKIFE